MRVCGRRDVGIYYTHYERYKFYPRKINLLEGVSGGGGGGKRSALESKSR